MTLLLARGTGVDKMDFYNEIDPHAAQWLRNLIDRGTLPPGVVDERDIRDIRPDELRGYRQVHAFGAAVRVGSGSAFEGKSRAKMLRGYGNAIVLPLAIEFIAAAAEALGIPLAGDAFLR